MKKIVFNLEKLEAYSEGIISNTGAMDNCLKNLPISDKEKAELEQCITNLMYSVAALGFLEGYQCGRISKR